MAETTVKQRAFAFISLSRSISKELGYPALFT